MSASDLGNPASEGARHLRKYLDFAERGTAALEMELGEAGLNTDSPFEDSVIAAVRSWGYDVQPQVGLAGYRIDIGVRSPSNSGAYILGIECDGAMYHSSKTARDRDKLRHDVLEGLGWEIYHIWGTAWYRHRDRELMRLRAKLEEQAVLPLKGRLAVKDAGPPEQIVEVTFEDNASLDFMSWTVEYIRADPPQGEAKLDFSATVAHSDLVAFVKHVVSIEEPIHIDLLVQRLKVQLNPPKVGKEIRQKLDRAIVSAGIERDSDFLWISSSAGCFVRRAHPLEVRDVSQILDLEFQGAILKLVQDSTGISMTELGKSVGQIFGWKRIGPVIQARIASELSVLEGQGEISFSGNGYSAK
jgi:very-short-patch-repair endonuclease